MDTKTIIDSAGGPVAVGALFGISSQAVSQWRQVPPERCVKLEELTLPSGITRHHMRPDIFGPIAKKTHKNEAA